MRNGPLHFFPEDDPLLTSADVAKRLDVVPERVRQLRREGKLTPLYTTPSRVALFATSDVLELAKERQKFAASGKKKSAA